MSYELLDSGHGRKWERFGAYRLIRPCSGAPWAPATPSWKAEGEFGRAERWQGSLPKEWTVDLEGVTFKLKPTEFGHLGLFPEHAVFWPWLRDQKVSKVLNLFAYSGGATLAAAQSGAQVTHVDAARGMVGWARENAALNGLDQAPIRWLVEDARKMIARAVRRGESYDGIILDPPSFGRGKSGEVFKIENDLPRLLDACSALKPRFLLLSCHTPGYTPLTLHHLLAERFSGKIDVGEMVLPHPARPVPCGTFARWQR